MPEKPSSSQADGPSRLTAPEDWTRTWSTVRTGPLNFNHRHRSFAGIDDLFSRHLPRGESRRFLELGCCPGTYLRYFHDRFGYQPTGLDYLEEGCEETRARCAADGLEAEIIHADLFDFTCDPDHPPWDVVASFGVVEHFDDVVPCLQRHVDLVAPGGFIAIVIPNHAGLGGSILRRVDPERHAMHNLMTWDDLRTGLERTGRVDILGGGYVGRLGFWNTALYRRARRLGRLPHAAIKAPLILLEQAGRVLPNSAYLSPNVAVVARRTE